MWDFFHSEALPSDRLVGCTARDKFQDDCDSEMHGA